MSDYWRCETCPIPEEGCEGGGGGYRKEKLDRLRFGHTECVACGFKFKCEADHSAITEPDENGWCYPVCHPQDCWNWRNQDKIDAWNKKYRATEADIARIENEPT